MGRAADITAPAVGRQPQSNIAAGLARALTDSGYSGLVLDRLARQACRLLGVERSCIYVRDDSHPGMSIVAAGHGVDDDLIGTRIARREGALPRIVFCSPEGPRPGARRFQRVEGATEAPSSTAVLAPFGWDGSVHGELSAETDRPERIFAEGEIDNLNELAQLVGAAVRHFQTREEAFATARDGVAAVVHALDERDRYTAWHSEEVVDLARAVGLRLGLDRTELFELELAALLHDLGKIGVPDSVLHKPGPLDSEEMALMQLHPIWGAELLAGIPGLEAVATIVRFHHERVDGRGYPAGLTGERIPLASRIIAACDAYHAMTSDRPYRDGLDEETALAELRECSGSQFDPAAVDALTTEIQSHARVA
jgi:hypothetical protein